MSHEFELTELQYAEPEKGSAIKVFLYDPEGHHYGAVWAVHEIRYEGEEILMEDAKLLVEDHIGRGLEVRICNVGDMLIFHSKDGKVLYPDPNHPENFWSRL